MSPKVNRNLRCFLVTLLCIVAFVAPVRAQAPQLEKSDPLQDPFQENRVQTLGKLLRCAVCQGLSITDSPASMARSQLDKVRELVTLGKSNQDIKDYFTARYGEWVLLEPRAYGFNWLVWALPGILLMVGAGLIAHQLRKAPVEIAASTEIPGDLPRDQSAFLEELRKEVNE